MDTNETRPLLLLVMTEDDTSAEITAFTINEKFKTKQVAQFGIDLWDDDWKLDYTNDLWHQFDFQEYELIQVNF